MEKFSPGLYVFFVLKYRVDMVSKNGKFLRGGAKTRHILEKKSPKAKRRLGGTHVVKECDAGHIRKLLPYGE